MIHKIVKLFLVLGVILFSMLITSCYKEEKFTFSEEKYEYIGEQFTFYNDVEIKYISLNFTSTDDSNDKTNILINRKNKTPYYVDFYFENVNQKGVFCNFQSLEKVGDQTDKYYIELDISKLINVENAIAVMVLTITNPNYENNEIATDVATRIILELKKFTIDKTNVDVTEYSFPSKLILQLKNENE